MWTSQRLREVDFYPTSGLKSRGLGLEDVEEEHFETPSEYEGSSVQTPGLTKFEGNVARMPRDSFSSKTSFTRFTPTRIGHKSTFGETWQAIAKFLN